MAQYNAPMRVLERKSNLGILLRRPGRFARAYRWPLLILLLGALADAATTHRMLAQWGPQAEVHLVGRLLVEQLGVPVGVWLGKGLQTVVAIFVASVFRWWCGGLMVLAGVLYALAAASNHFGWL